MSRLVQSAIANVTRAHVSSHPHFAITAPRTTVGDAVVPPTLCPSFPFGMSIQWQTSAAYTIRAETPRSVSQQHVHRALSLTGHP